MIRLIALSVAFLFAAAAARAAPVEIDAVARVTVIPEDRSDVKVEIVRASPDLPLEVRIHGGHVRIEGGVSRKIRNCRIEDGHPVVHVLGLGDVAFAHMPQVVVRTPRAVEVASSGAVYGVVGRSTSLDLAGAGCGDWTVGDVQGDLRISLAGSGGARAGRAGSARLKLAGSGGIATAAIRGGAAIDMAGSGDVALASVSGPLDVRMAGSGDVVVAGGRATPMSVSIAGSGNVVFHGVADALRARVAGSGDVRVRAVRGEVRKSVIGSGAVVVG